MTLQEQLMAEVKAAMKDGRKETVTILRGLQSQLKNKAIELKRELDDAEVIVELKTVVKQTNDAMADFVKAERDDLVAKSKAELEIIKGFLPTPMEREKIKEHVVSIAKEIGATTLQDMGKLMGAVMKAVGTAADGGDVKAEVEAHLKGE